jgi:hypothetical protein
MAFKNDLCKRTDSCGDIATPAKERMSGERNVRDSLTP